MKNKIISNIHILLILMAVMNLFDLYELNTEKIESSLASIESLKAKKAQQQRKLKQIIQFKENLVDSKERVREVVRQIEKVQKQLPTNVNGTEVASNITNLSESLKLQNIKVIPKDEVMNGFYFTKKYSFKAEGTFLQIIVLLENLQKSERILNVKNFEIKQITEKVRGKFKVLSSAMSIESFRYNSSYIEKSGVEEIENEFKVP